MATTSTDNSAVRIISTARYASSHSAEATTDIELGPIVKGVTLKMAFDQGWAVADRAETKSERFTSPESLDMVHRLRRCSDAVLVGRGTVEEDDCSLTVRRVPMRPGQKQPVRVVVDPRLSLFVDPKLPYRLFQDGLPTIVYYAVGSDEGLPPIEKNDVTLVPLSIAHVDGELALTLFTTAIMQDLQERELYHVMVEGGPATARAFLRDRVIDRAILIRAPVTFQQPFPSHMSEEILQDGGLQKLGTSTFGGDIVDYWSRPGLPWPTDEFSQWP